MSASGLTAGAATEVPSPTRRRRFSWPAVLLGVAGLLVLLSLVRVVTGAGEITSSGTVGAALALAVPIGMAGLGGLWSERAGVVNIGLEGMMILGTWGAGWAGYQYGPWAGALAGVLLGAFGGLLHAVATVGFGVDHIVSGVAVNILGLGLTKYLSALLFAGVPGGGETQSPPIPDLTAVTVPGLSPALGAVEQRRWLLVSDLAGILRGLVTGLSLLTVLAVVLIVVSYLVLWRTPFGLRLRACGESPYAAETLGVNVYLHKYVAVIVSGAFAGFGGAFLAIVAASAYLDGQTGGRGFIGLAAMIFGNWRPGGLAAGSLLFGYTDALQLRRGGESVHALLLLVGVLLLAVAAWQVTRSRVRVAVVAAVVAVLVLAWFATTDEVPGDFTAIAPYVTTLLVLALASQRLRMPAADGLPYRRGGL